jgi:hypothetical protein
MSKTQAKNNRLTMGIAAYPPEVESGQSGEGIDMLGIGVRTEFFCHTLVARKNFINTNCRTFSG